MPLNDLIFLKVSPYYKKELQEFPSQIAQLLEQHGGVLEPELRRALVQALVLMRNRNVVTASSLLPLFFRLFRLPDKKIRGILYNHIVQDIKKINRKKKDEKSNRALQNFMYTMLQDDAHASRKSLEVMIELFRKGVWKDSKTVNVIASAIFTKDSKTLHTVLNFFLSPKYEQDDLKQDKEFNINKKEIYKKFGHGAVKRTNKKKKKLKEALAELSKQRKSQMDRRMDDRRNYNFQAVNMIVDPQGYSEKVYKVLTSSNEKFETKIMIMNFISRLVACHQLLIFDFYSLMQKYLQPHQNNITQMMSITAQSCHPLVPPDVVEPIIKSIANNFVSDRRANEAIVVGLNTIREICLRSPLAMSEELLSDLVQYKENKDSGIAMAAKSLITLFRVLNPSLLPKKLRGKHTDMDAEPAQYGQQTINYFDEEELMAGNFEEKDEEKSGDWESVDSELEDYLDDDEEGEELEEGEEFEEAGEDISGEEDGEEVWESADDSDESGEDEASDDGDEWVAISDDKKSSIDNKKKRMRELMMKIEEMRDKDVNAENLEAPKKKFKMSKEERIEVVRANQEERKLERVQNEEKPKTQKVAARNKPYMMVRYSRNVRSKSGLSMHDKRKKQGAHLDKLRKLNKKVKSKVLKKR